MLADSVSEFSARAAARILRPGRRRRYTHDALVTDETAAHTSSQAILDVVRAAGFDAARRLSIDRLRLAPSDRVLIVGAGTGLDLDFVPSNVHVTAIDVTPAMLEHLERRAAGTGRSVTTRIIDDRRRGH